MQGGGRLPTLPCRNPAGGLPSLSPAYPAFSLLSCPHPPDPRSQSALPGGKGETKGYFMQGASPLASPGLNPGGTGFSCGKRCPNGGLPGRLPADLALPEPGGELARVVADRPRLAGTRRGAQGGVACLPFTLTSILPPSPQPPSRREGGDFRLFYARGFAPCIPGVKSLTALTNSAVSVSGGKLAMEPGMSLRS